MELPPLFLLCKLILSLVIATPVRGPIILFSGLEYPGMLEYELSISSAPCVVAQSMYFCLVEKATVLEV